MRFSALIILTAGTLLALAGTAAAQNVSLWHQAGPGVARPAASTPPLNGKPVVEPVAMTGMLAAQNGVRQRIGLSPLTWSSDLASKAEAAASTAASNRNCSTNSVARVGAAEGLAVYWAAGLSRIDGTVSIQTITPSFLVSEWSAGRGDYDLARNACRRSGVCDQYARMVSQNAHHVGCAKAICPNQAQVWICRYDDSAAPVTVTARSPAR
jgi:pathogenesis-related protein 1